MSAEPPKSSATTESAPQAGPRTLALNEAQKKFLLVEPIGASDGGDVIRVPGRIGFRPQAQSAVGSAVSGRVFAVLVQVGAVVNAGTPLVLIDSADAAGARAALDASAARLTASDMALRRQVEMMDKGVGIELERQEAETRLREARVEHDRARHAVEMIGAGQGSRFTVRAPARGIVIGVKAAAGAVVAPGGEPLVELGNPEQLQVIAQVPESDLRRIAVGQEGEVEIPDQGARFSSRVEGISPRMELESRRAAVYLSLGAREASALPADALRAGMMAWITLRIPSDPGLSLPVSAVLIKGGERRVVYVELSDGRYQMREVRVGRSQNGRVRIVDGLTAGERVVVRGALLLDTQAEQLL